MTNGFRHRNGVLRRKHVGQIAAFFLPASRKRGVFVGQKVRKPLSIESLLETDLESHDCTEGV